MLGGEGELRTRFWQGYLKERENLENLDADIIIIRWALTCKNLLVT
jgi:hypothetical protein